MRTLSLCLGLALAACGTSNPAGGTAPDGGAVDAAPGRVDPFIGTGGNGYNVGSAFPGGAAPNGMVAPSPDTIGPKWGDARFLHCSGYWFGDDTIQGFSNLHMHGTGVPDYGVLALMPVPSFDATKTTKLGYQSTFKKASEQAEPGYYAVTVDNGAIRVELTATQRAAYHRYTFVSGAASGHVVIDLAHVLDMGTVAGGSITLFPSEGRVRGSFRSFGDMSGGWGYPVHFEARVRGGWKSALLWSNTAPTPAAATTIGGDQVGADLEFDTSGGTPVEIVLGVSYVSEDNAAANLTTEIPTFDFDGTRAATKAAWDAILALAKIDGGTTASQTLFRSALYHAFVMPATQTDVDGSYVGFDMKVHHADYDYASNLSLWDTYRTLNPLYALLAPARARAVARSLVEMGMAAGHLPKWPLADGDSGSMVGASAEIVLADSYLRGVTDFDAKGAYALMRAAAMDTEDPPGGRGGRDGVVPYMQYGYVPATTSGSVSITVEYANDDFALGNLAAALGETDDAAALLARRLGYRKLFDPATGFLRARLANGNFAKNAFDPTDASDDYVEANGWQSLWVAHDVDGMIALFGGRQAFVAQLEMMFELTRMDWDAGGNTLGQRALPPPYYWAGNEPDLHASYMFAQAGRPDLTQKWARWAATTYFGTGSDGIPGNDDGGTMSAWYVFTAIGFYPVAGSDLYVVGAPLFPHVELSIGGGVFTITANQLSDVNIYVQSAMLNGQPLTKAALHQSDLKAGGSLVLEMGPGASSWGRID